MLSKTLSRKIQQQTFTTVNSLQMNQRYFSSSASSSDSSHSKIVIIGGGAGGVSVSSQLIKSGKVKAQDITVVDPSEFHYYQPCFTMIGGGVFGDAKKINQSTYVKRPMKSMLFPGLKLNAKAVVKVDPDQNQLTLQQKGDSSIETLNYDYLIVSPGVSLRYDKIPGAIEALEDPQSPVGSIYRVDFAFKTSSLREHFSGGKAIFTLPTMPIKCGGAPQKVMYLSEETWRRQGIRKDCNIHFYTSVGNMFPNCAKYADKLKQIVKEKDIEVHYQHTISKVDKDSRKVTFKLANGEEVTENYDFLHVVPPQTAPEFITSSKLAAANGFVDVNINTLRHNKYANVFAIGDCANLPTAKTAAGVFSQAPVLVHNFLAQLENPSANLNASYDGYSSCPVFVGDRKLMMIEFKYENQPAETFYDGQTTPNHAFYYMKKEVFPRVYFNLMPRGIWYGRKCLIKPSFV